MRGAFLGGLAAGCLSTAGLVNVLKYISKEGGDMGLSVAASKESLPTQNVAENLYGEGTRAAEILSGGRPLGGRIYRQLENHVLEYDCASKIPVWVAQHLSATLLKGEANRRKSKFQNDPGIPVEFSANNRDYSGSGWSRGHMAPAGDNKNSQSSMDETFYLTNILPQDYKNNAGFWNRLEMFCRDLTQRYPDVWVTSGPLFLPKVRDDGRKVVEYEVIGETEIAVPTHLYKVVVGRSDKESTPSIAAFIVPNAPLDYSHHLKDFQVPLQKLERKAGLKFYSNLNREESRDLCEETGCNLMTKDEMDKMIYHSRLKRAHNQDKLVKLWKEIEGRGFNIDTSLQKVYGTQLANLLNSEQKNNNSEQKYDSSKQKNDRCEQKNDSSVKSSVTGKPKDDLTCQKEESRAAFDMAVRAKAQG